MKTVDSFRVHCLKTWPEPFAALRAGDKTCEVRKNDRRFAVGDVLRLEEYLPDSCLWTGDRLDMLVTHIVTGFGLPDDLVAMSVRPIVWLLKSCISCGEGFKTYDEAHTTCGGCL